MNTLFIYNTQLRQKQKFAPVNHIHVLIRYIPNPMMPEHHIKRLRHMTVVHMISRWLRASGAAVSVSHCPNLTTPHDIAIVDNQILLDDDATAYIGSHVMPVGDVLAARKATGDEDLYCAENYIKTYGAEVIRYFLLRSQYRTTIQFTKLQVEDARRSLDRFYRALRSVPPSDVAFDPTQAHVRRFIEAMNDDFNMLKIVAVLNELANAVTASKSADMAAQLKYLGSYLDILQDDPTAFLHRPVAKTLAPESKWSFLKQVDARDIALRKIA